MVCAPVLLLLLLLPVGSSSENRSSCCRQAVCVCCAYVCWMCFVGSSAHACGTIEMWVLFASLRGRERAAEASACTENKRVYRKAEEAGSGFAGLTDKLRHARGDTHVQG